ncbi:MAG: hypothetical protein HY898_33345 [Deltaproteobacteria bacterium]|nr:hypothetical protein [Deltaproteobacteria bacterium]
MRRIGHLLLVQAIVSVAAVASAQQPGSDPQPDKAPPAPTESARPAEPPAPPTPTVAAPPAAATTPPPAQRPAATAPPSANAPAPPKVEEQEYVPRLLAPTFAEDRYPGDPVGGQTDVELSRGGKLPPLRFALHGYFRAPMRFSRVHRAAGTTTSEEGEYNYRTPFLVDDDYYKSGFLYLPINERAWNETYLSVGNERMTATVGLASTQFSDAETPTIDKQFGIAQGWLTYRYKIVEGLGLRVKGGAFWDRFGYLPKYDTYIFGRTHQVGGQARLEFQTGPFTFWVLDGVGTHGEDIASKHGLTMVHYAHGGVSYDRTVEVGVYYLNASTKDKRQFQDITDSDMTVLGVDARVSTLLGKGYVAYSSIDANRVLYLSPALEVMHSYGRRIMDNYLGTDAKTNGGMGFLKNLAFQYDFSVANLYRGLMKTKASPLPWGGDITASVFGMLTKVQSDQPTDWSTTDTIRDTRRDGVSKWKWGTEGGWRATEWAGIFLRYDHVVPDQDDSATTFRVISPRIALFTHFLTQEMIFVQFSRYWYKQAVQLRQGEIQGERYPDEKVFKLQAQITY